VLFFTNLLLFESVTFTSMSYFNIIKLNATPSTNDFLKERHQKGLCKEGDLVWAKDQTSGRGQRDRTWVSSFENSLTFSIYKTYEHFSSAHTFAISVAVAVGIMNALHALNIQNLSIKWPNDILSENKKIAGILIENIFKQGNLKASIIGIGLNINQMEFQDLPNATSLALATDKKWEVNLVFKTLKVELEKILFSLDSIILNDLFSEYTKLLWRKDKITIFKKNGKYLNAILKGITTSGSLIIEDEKGEIMELTSNQVRMLYDN
jgi:BirA family biotin operon repressor/biotin-[acetyl-CoA-carboxylase] ligase